MTSARAQPEHFPRGTGSTVDKPTHRWARVRGVMNRCPPGGLLRGDNGGVFAAVVAGCVVVSLAAAGYGAVATVQTAADNADSFANAHSALGANIATLESESSSLTALVLAARVVLADSQGKVLDPSVLVNAQVDLAQLDSAVAGALATQKIGLTAQRVRPEWLDSGQSQIEAGTIVRAATDRVRAGEAASKLTSARILTAVAAWNAEQARIAAAALAAAEAHAAAQAAAAASAQSRTANKAPVHRTAAKVTSMAPSVFGITVNVRALVHGTSSDNGQAQIDQGGEVAIDWGAHGTIVSAHNRNDARALRLTVGERVTFTGAVSGTYVVTGAIAVNKGASVAEVDSLGVKMFMQTCFFTGGQMRVVGLRPV